MKRTPIAAIAAAALLLAAFLRLYWPTIAKLVSDWSTDENYSHGFLIVPIALYLVWERRARLVQTLVRPATISGLVLVMGSIAVLAAGSLGAELFLQRTSIIGLLAGVTLFLFGWGWLRILLFPLIFLLLMVPIPAIIFNQIAFPLQLLASRFGETTLLAAGIPVLREGNVITLANTTLEVAEACSGIRSLISLLTLAIVYGYFIEPRPWARVVLALASVPVAIVANGLRVAGTGIGAHYFGEEAALGFFHTFSGWLVFVVAFVLLFALHGALRLAERRRPSSASPTATADADGVAHSALGERGVAVAAAPGVGVQPESPVSPLEAQGTPDAAARGDRVDAMPPPVPVPLLRVAVVALLLVAGWVGLARASSQERLPPREAFATFPMTLGQWQGYPAPRFDQQVLTVLGVDEYVTRNYVAPDGGLVHLYVGYYQSQREGDTMHSPLNCLPGAGWQPVSRGRLAIPVRTATAPGAPERTIDVNRIVIRKGTESQLVVYWYQSRDRVVASEYWGKIYTVLDAIRYNRTDAAMLRLISPVAHDVAGAEARAEQLARELVQEVYPLLGRYLPE